jgi:uncharacterized RDD family membrane protein YckC
MTWQQPGGEGDQPHYGRPQDGQPHDGQPPHGQPQYGQPPPPPPFGQGYGFGTVGGLPAGVEYAGWGSRLGAYLLDYLVALGTTIPALISLGIGAATAPDALDGSTGSPLPALFVGLFFLLLLLPLAFVVWNTYRTGATGQSLGKGWMGIHLVSSATMRPPGPGAAFGKYILRSLLSQVTCGIYGLISVLWPLWDVRHQSLDDKIVNTLVVRFAGNRPL